MAITTTHRQAVIFYQATGRYSFAFR